MAAIVNTALSGFTVDYNGVQFGGSDATYASLPPTYSLRSTPQWDSSGRSIMWVDCILQVNCIFFGANESYMGNSMRAIRLALMTPGKTLKLMGLGSGFDWINYAGAATRSGDVLDIANGPKTLDLQQNSFGQLAWELIWVVKFSVVPCVTTGEGVQALAFMAFNFSTTWRNDFEGYSSRIIQGSVLIPNNRTAASPKTVQHVAEETRGQIVVAIPPGFKRVDNTWSESEDHQTLSFSIIDEQLQGDPYPPGITAADGNFSFISGGAGNISMSQAVCTLNMTLKTAYNKPRNLAGQIFMAAVLSKQTQLQAGATPTIVVVPIHLSISNGRFDSARITQASMSWHITKSFAACLAAAGIWDPVDLSSISLDGSYTQWRASMTALWGNRGTAGLVGSATEAVIIDLCDNLITKTIGTQGSSPNVLVNATLPSVTCPNIPTNGGWIHFDLDIRLHREDGQSRHKPAVSYLPATGTVEIEYSDQPTIGPVKVGGHSYSQDSSSQSVTEYHGHPEFLVGLSFSGLRFKHSAWMPEIKSVGGKTARLVSQEGGTPKFEFDSFGCPVWSVSGYRVYSIPGYVSEIAPVSSLIATDTSVPYEL